MLLAFVGSYAYWRETNNVIHFKLYSQNLNNLRDKGAYLLIIRRQIPTKASNGNVELKIIINISRLVLHLQVICIILRWWNYLTSNRESNTPKREWSIKAKANCLQCVTSAQLPSGNSHWPAHGLRPHSSLCYLVMQNTRSIRTVLLAR